MTQAVQASETALLASFPILRTEDLAEARAVVGRAFCDHRLDLRHGTRLRAAHDHVSGAHVSLNALGYGAEVEIDPGMLGGFYLLQIPLAGAARVDHRGETVDATPVRATLLNPDRETRMVWGEDCRKLLLQVDRTHLEEVAEAMLGAALPGPVRFDPAVEMTRGPGRQLRARVLAAAGAASSGALWSCGAGLREAWAERELARALLELQPSNIYHMLWRSERQPAARALRRAAVYLQENFAEPIRIEEVAALAGLNPRSLQQGFAAAFGKSPKRYLTDLRLDAARYRLNRRCDRESVTEVAYSCGFTHLGRFSREYRARFGESPRAGR